MDTLSNKKKILSQQLDAQIQKLSSTHHSSKPSEDNLAPFQVLEKRLKILQQKLNKPHQTQYSPPHQKLYSLSSNKKYKAYHFLDNSNEQSCQEQKQIKQSEPHDNQRKSEKQGIINITHQSEVKIINQKQQDKNQSSKRKNQSSTKRKVIRAKSQNLESGQVTHKNSKMATPQKKKEVIVSHIQFDGHSHKFYKNLHKNFEIDENSHTEQKMKPRNLSSNKKSRTKSTTKQKKIIQKKLVEYEDNQRKHKSYKIFDNNIFSYSYEPLIPLRQKIKLQRELKEYSKQNIKLKGKIGQLKKFEQQFWKMKEIFNKFEKHRLKNTKLNSMKK